jgi:hypothetical protein
MPYGGTRIVTPATPLKLGCGPAVIQCRVDARWLQARKKLSETPRPTLSSVAFPRHSAQMLPLRLCWLAACTGLHSAFQTAAAAALNTRLLWDLSA